MTESSRAQTPLSDSALQALLERNMPALRAFIRLRMGDALSARESSSDVLQSVCRELIAAGDHVQFDGEAAFRSWLYTAALRKILQKARQHGAQMRAVDREQNLSDEELANSYATCITPSRDASAREQVDRFESAFARLSETDREVIALTKIAGLPHAEVAERLHRSPESSRTLLRRALIRLSALMQPDSN